MNDITTEQKLQVVQQIRSQYRQNQYDMSRRERILYSHNIEPFEDKSTSESFRMRCVVAIMLFIFAVLFDLFDINPLGMEMQHIFEIIASQ